MATPHKRGPKPRSIEQLFWPKVEVRGPDDCWEWKAYRRAYGYGELGIGGRILKAHRVSYELHHGPIGDGLFVCHRCDNPPCVNPAHLFIGTNADNVADMVAKRRHLARKRDKRTRLLDDDVRWMRWAHDYAGVDQATLAAAFAVTQPHVSKVLAGKRKHEQSCSGQLVVKSVGGNNGYTTQNV